MVPVARKGWGWGERPDLLALSAILYEENGIFNNNN